MKKYTAIYTDHFMCGSHHSTLVNMKRVELKKNETLTKAMIREGIDESTVFLFEGWPELEGSYRELEEDNV